MHYTQFSTFKFWLYYTLCTTNCEYLYAIFYLSICMFDCNFVELILHFGI